MKTFQGHFYTHDLIPGMFLSNCDYICMVVSTRQAEERTYIRWMICDRNTGEWTVSHELCYLPNSFDYTHPDRFYLSPVPAVAR
jgi:hypothetical protein